MRGEVVAAEGGAPPEGTGLRKDIAERFGMAKAGASGGECTETGAGDDNVLGIGGEVVFAARPREKFGGEVVGERGTAGEVLVTRPGRVVEKENDEGRDAMIGDEIVEDSGSGD